ncbi:hypothetical protein HDU76_002453 [Blyttiomyces sp. JEL0837]|nr:hypothetical protein HDU76_002453 [Blyttiomyces sp. JEL0837]
MAKDEISYDGVQDLNHLESGVLQVDDVPTSVVGQTASTFSQSSQALKTVEQDYLTHIADSLEDKVKGKKRCRRVGDVVGEGEGIGGIAGRTRSKWKSSVGQMEKEKEKEDEKQMNDKELNYELSIEMGLNVLADGGALELKRSRLDLRLGNVDGANDGVDRKEDETMKVQGHGNNSQGSRQVGRPRKVVASDVVNTERVFESSSKIGDDKMSGTGSMNVVVARSVEEVQQGPSTSGSVIHQKPSVPLLAIKRRQRSNVRVKSVLANKVASTIDNSRVPQSSNIAINDDRVADTAINERVDATETIVSVGQVQHVSGTRTRSAVKKSPIVPPKRGRKSNVQTTKIEKKSVATKRRRGNNLSVDEKMKYGGVPEDVADGIRLKESHDKSESVEKTGIVTRALTGGKVAADVTRPELGSVESTATMGSFQQEQQLSGTSSLSLAVIKNKTNALPFPKKKGRSLLNAQSKPKTRSIAVKQRQVVVAKEKGKATDIETDNVSLNGGDEEETIQHDGDDLVQELLQELGAGNTPKVVTNPDERIAGDPKEITSTKEKNVTGKADQRKKSRVVASPADVVNALKRCREAERREAIAARTEVTDVKVGTANTSNTAELEESTTNTLVDRDRGDNITQQEVQSSISVPTSTDLHFSPSLAPTSSRELQQPPLLVSPSPLESWPPPISVYSNFPAPSETEGLDDRRKRPAVQTPATVDDEEDTRVSKRRKGAKAIDLDEKRRKRSNNEAAKRYYQRRKEREEEVQKSVRELKEENTGLKTQNEQLHQEILFLKVAKFFLTMAMEGALKNILLASDVFNQVQKSQANITWAQDEKTIYPGDADKMIREETIRLDQLKATYEERAREAADAVEKVIRNCVDNERQKIYTETKALQERIKKLESGVQKRDQEIESLRQLVEESSQKVKEAELKVQKATQERTELMKLVQQQWDEHMKSMKRAISDAEVKIEKGEGSISQASMHASAIIQQLQAANVELSSRKRKLEEIINEDAAGSLDITQVRVVAEISKVTTEVEGCKQNLATLQTLLKDTKNNSIAFPPHILNQWQQLLHDRAEDLLLGAVRPNFDNIVNETLDMRTSTIAEQLQKLATDFGERVETLENMVKDLTEV